MKSNSYFRTKTSAPTLNLEASEHGSLAALMGRFRNEGQQEDYCLRAKFNDVAPSSNSMLNSKYSDPFDRETKGFHQVINKENMWNNTTNPSDNKFKQLTPKRQQFFGQFKQQRKYSKSPINTNYHGDNTNKFVFKAKQNKVLGNLIQMAENYQTQQVSRMASPGKNFLKKQISYQSSFPDQKQLQQKNNLTVNNQQLEKQIINLKQNLSNISFQSLPQQAIKSAIHIEVQDFLSRIFPTRSAASTSVQKSKNQNLMMQTSQGLPVNFSFDINYNDFSRNNIDFSSSDQIQSSQEKENNELRCRQKDQFLIDEPLLQPIGLVTSQGSKALGQS